MSEVAHEHTLPVYSPCYLEHLLHKPTLELLGDHYYLIVLQSRGLIGLSILYDGFLHWLNASHLNNVYSANISGKFWIFIYN